jgi:predicted nucleotidyltransferase component of viral defense system
MNVLTPLQRDFLHNFFAQPASAPFALHGGTALAAFYLRHRVSEDVDLFAVAPLRDEELKYCEILDFGQRAALTAALSVGATSEHREPTALFHQIFLMRAGEPRLKIDMVRDPGPLFGDVQGFDDIRVSSLLDIAVSKVTAILGRLAARDYVDLCFLLHSGFEFEQLLELAKQKDLGLNEFYLGLAMKAVEKVSPADMPRMLMPIDLDEMKRFFVALAQDLVRRIKPA